MTSPGEIIAERWRYALGSDRIRIVRADPETVVSAEALRQLRVDPHPDVTIRGDVMTINAENGRWVYRIGEYEPQLDAYRMYWPD